MFLDAECACWGDPAFDLAFCLNHLVLKAVHAPDHAPRLAASFDALASAYLAGTDWEPAGALEGRAAALLPALALARIDGKYPVEYLSQPARARVRRLAIPMVLTPPPTLNSAAAPFWAKQP